MDLSLSRRGDYAVRAALYLARQEHNELASVREIAAAMAIPQSFAGQVLADLARARILAARTGRGGGYWLDREPKDISLLEIVEAAEGTLRAERCALGDGPCRWDSVCPMHAFWQQAVGAVREQLAAVTLADLREADVALEVGVAAPPDAHRHGAIQTLSDMVWIEVSAEVVRAQLASLDREELITALAPRLRAAGDLALIVCEFAHPGTRLVLELSDPVGRAARAEIDLSVEATDELRSALGASVRWRGELAEPRRTIRAALTGLGRLLEGAPRPR